MKVIKRDGHIVDYDKEKIEIAIGKANAEVIEEERATPNEIKKIIKYIESLNKKRILVEDIQDIIEIKLMEAKRYELAKHYIVYRYTRALVRKSNTTDESILSLIRKENMELNKGSKNTTLAGMQRDYIAGEVSKDLTRRMLLPYKISNAHDEGILYFHDMDYFIQPIFNSSLINLEDMLDNGTVINNELIESPKSFQEACTIMMQIIACCSANQYGGISLEIKVLGKYLRKSHDNLMKRFKTILGSNYDRHLLKELVDNELSVELESGVKILERGVKTLLGNHGNTPLITFFLNLDSNDTYIKENAMIIESILHLRYEGIKNDKGIYVALNVPKLVYVLDENNCLKGGKYDYLTELALKCSAKRMEPVYVSAQKMRENYEGNVFAPMGYHSFLSPWKDETGTYRFRGRFNQGIVTINLAQIGILAEEDETKFWELLDERLDLCRETLMCRHHALLGTTSDISPIHWQYGAIARLGKGEKIDKYLRNGYSTLSLGYIGLYEATKLIKGVSHTDEEKGLPFAKRVVSYMKDKCLAWKKETGLGFVLYGTSNATISNELAKIDLEKFGKIKDVTDKGYYTNGYDVDGREKLSAFDKINFASSLQNSTLGGSCTDIEVGNTDMEAMRKVLKYMYENLQYGEFNIKNDYCYACGYEGEIPINKELEWECPKCGNKDQNKLYIVRRYHDLIEDDLWSLERIKEIKERANNI